jgi:PAS domain S-box-containing protein
MDKELRILILEDVVTDAELMEHELRKRGIIFSSRCVQTKKAFLKELKDFTPDIILADYSLPQFDCISALEIAKEKCPAVPFIIVSGIIGEELAVETIKYGATDYVFKQRLSRLAPSVRRALTEAEELAECKRAEEALRESEGKLNAMLQSIGDHMSMMDKDLNIIWANETAKKLFGNDVVGKKCYEAYHKRKEPCEPYPCLTLKAFQDGKVHEHDTQVIDKNGGIIYFHCTANVALRDNKGKPAAVIEISRDITDSKLAEETLRKNEKELQKRVKELAEFYNMAVNRELRMVELKKELEIAKKELKKYKNHEI